MAKVQLVTADAKEKDGMVSAKVRMAEAEALQKYGTAEAEALRLKLEAEATGNEKLGMAQVNVRTADANAVAKQGEAEALAIEAKFQAEAKGLKEKFEAMKAMSPETKDHEELRLRLNNNHVEVLKTIEAQTSIAREQADVLGKAMGNARIDIVGGEGDYFQRFVNALAVGKGIDGTINKSQTLQVALKDHLDGKRDVVGDAKELIGALGHSSGELENLSVAALLTKVLRDGNSDQKKSLLSLLEGHLK
jgi:hypothetical protein